MTPSTARVYHEKKIIEFKSIEVSNTDTVHLLANSRENPTERQIKYMFDKWRFTQSDRRQKMLDS